MTVIEATVKGVHGICLRVITICPNISIIQLFLTKGVPSVSECDIFRVFSMYVNQVIAETEYFQQASTSTGTLPVIKNNNNTMLFGIYIDCITELFIFNIKI